MAVTTGAMAEVTISGAAGYGYQSTNSTKAGVPGLYILADGTSGTGTLTAAQLTAGGVQVQSAVAAGQVKDKGFGVDTAEININVTEDLGGGLTLGAGMSVGGLARSATVTGQNMTMSLSGGFGTVMMGAIEIGSGIRGLAQAGAPVNNMEGEVLSAAGNSDIVKYTAPKMGDFTLSASLTEPVGLADGMGTGDKSAATVGVDYAAGALKAKLDYTNYDSDATSINHRYRIAAQYNLGVAVIGYGLENQTLVAGTKNKLTMLGVSVPLTSALKVGFVVTTSDAAATAGKKTGNSYGASYAMSKRTSLTANAAKWEVSEAAGAVKDSKTTILLNHSF